MIRVAKPTDVPRMLAIYAPYVDETSVSMEYDPPTPEAFAGRFERVTGRYPWLVWEEDGAVLGYAYADRALERAGYRWDAELSIYLCPEARGRGIGGMLYDALEALLARLGYRNLYALVTGDNLASCRFHEKRGYALEGLLKSAALKSGRWYDLCWYTLCPGGDDAPGEPPKAFEGSL